MTNAELLAFLFLAPTDEVNAAEETVRHWLTQSRRFQAFMTENRVKIRKKLSLAQTPEAQQSLFLELALAQCFAQDARCQVEYEKYGQGKTRQPDLTVTFRTRTAFNVEATRIQMAHAELEGRTEKFLRIVCDKLGQTVPEMLNCLVIATEGGSLTESEVSAAMKLLKQRVEQRDDKLLARTAFSKPADFFKLFQWLSVVVLCSETSPDNPLKTVLWTNTQSRHPLPNDIQVLLKSRIILTVNEQHGTVPE